MTTDITTQIIIVVATLLIALSMGLFLRYLLVRRLKKTVLDNWLIQILGFLIIIPPVIVGTIVASFFFGIQLPEMLAILQYVVKDILNVHLESRIEHTHHSTSNWCWTYAHEAPQ